jgi:hypothetical protein
MTAKEKVLEHLPRWTEDQAKRALLAAESNRDIESYTRTPQFEPDGWTDLEKVNEDSRNATLKRLDEEEREWPSPFGALAGTLPELEIDDIKAARRAALQSKTR